jgi:hypothetical protein
MTGQENKYVYEIVSKAEEMAKALCRGKDIEIQKRANGIVVIESSKKIIR